MVKKYMNCVGDLIFSPDVQNLEHYAQHGDISRLRHSLNVSYYSFLICRIFGLHYRDAARAGLLHDLFFYYWQDLSPENTKSHVLLHPRIALENARVITKLNRREEEIIALHMFPLCGRFPRFLETYIVSLVDKICAFMEALTFIKRIPRLCRVKIASRNR
ncbi:hydrolase [Brucepastera parasyntrophica]|uniref:HD domain-containing protein n=1 Tax=Brucepastera parasyntrophica TaxID=2880008 RepID=UPI00210C95A7|nr:HD domain-containing protein [Brucepastera parasyntrophica]ULQ58754.1 hydrolase [Brucepastera parasyntrophica]